MREDRKVKGAADKISNLPDVILQHILCFAPTTKVAISTSLLSRRWRHVWCEAIYLLRCRYTDARSGNRNPNSLHSFQDKEFSAP
ncbi:hypothetical protein Bca4012_073722 [Brassica carinata]|uniref:F-box domain-containing protein n=4 Tax=Brassica TaxID=3705 RepID=A0A0D3CIQ0_BRAOL|nr:unnamed protein product [Brassica oleracea]